MDFFLRFTLTVTLLISTFIGLAYSQPTWLEGTGLDFWKIAEFQKIMREEQTLADKLEMTRKIQFEKLLLKDQMLGDLIDGKLTLSECIEGYIRIGGKEGLESACENIQIECSNEQERYQKLLLYWIAKKLVNEPERAQIVKTRLQNEIRESRHRFDCQKHGRVETLSRAFND